MSEDIVKIKYCCDYMKDGVEGMLNAIHVSEMQVDKVIAPFYMNVDTNEGTLPAFLKYCPSCGTKLSEYDWETSWEKVDGMRKKQDDYIKCKSELMNAQLDCCGYPEDKK